MKRISWLFCISVLVVFAGCSSEDEDNNSCQGNDCNKEACSGQDCEKEKCSGQDCEKEKCSGQDCEKEECSGQDCEKEECSGQDCEKDIKDACDGKCHEDEICGSDGQCQKNCENDKVLCGEECINLEEKHLASCEACAENYCDKDNNLANGCEINTKADDSENCGSCGHVCDPGFVCTEGECKSSCEENQSWCGQCVVLSDLHLASCDACIEGYCDADENLSNGCEIDVKGDDVNNCGACGTVCDGVCVEGECHKSHRAMAPVGATMYVDSAKSGKTGTIPAYEYVKVMEEKGDMSRVIYQEKEGWVANSALMDACDDCPDREVVDLAEVYLYSKNPGMCTYDFMTHEPLIENLYDLGDPQKSNLTMNNYGYNNDCANFVSAILKTTGRFTHAGDIYNIGQLKTYCSGNDGYHQIEEKDAQPGDVWICGGDHAEMVVGRYKNYLVLIASNNFSGEAAKSADNCMNGPSTDPKYSTNGAKYQRVSYNDSDWCGDTHFVYSRH